MTDGHLVSSKGEVEEKNNRQHPQNPSDIFPCQLLLHFGTHGAVAFVFAALFFTHPTMTMPSLKETHGNW